MFVDCGAAELLPQPLFFFFFFPGRVTTLKFVFLCIVIPALVFKCHSHTDSSVLKGSKQGVTKMHISPIFLLVYCWVSFCEKPCVCATERVMIVKRNLAMYALPCVVALLIFFAS